jgi:hypothetical protein
MNCRYCKTTLENVFLDLGAAPPSNAYLNENTLKKPESWLPLRLLVCEGCWLVQTEDYAEREVFFSDEYAYFSSVSSTLTVHAKQFVSDAVHRFGLNADSMVVEVAANDGYLLQFVCERGIPCYGIEPTKSTGDAARSKGVEIIAEFFGEQLASSLANDGRSGNLIIANNVLAHVPDINDFVAGFSHLLQPTGVVVFEFHHLLQMIHKQQFDIAYHEHYSYLSLGTVLEILKDNGLGVFDVQEISPHGGSLRIFAQRMDSGLHSVTSSVSMVLEKENCMGMQSRECYLEFQSVAEKIKNDFLSFLIDAKNTGKKVAGYGAAAKGNTILNFAGVKKDLLEFVCDAAPSKQGRYLPGSRIPIISPARLAENRPDFLVILPWNISDEIKNEVSYIKQWGGKFVTVVPELVIH